MIFFKKNCVDPGRGGESVERVDLILRILITIKLNLKLKKKEKEGRLAKMSGRELKGYISKTPLCECKIGPKAGSTYYRAIPEF